MFHRLSLGIAPKDSYDTRSPGRFDIRTAPIDFKSIFYLGFKSVNDVFEIGSLFLKSGDSDA